MTTLKVAENWFECAYCLYDAAPSDLNKARLELAKLNLGLEMLNVQLANPIKVTEAVCAKLA